VTLRTVTVRVPRLIVASIGLGSTPVSDRPDGPRPRSAWSKAGHSDRGATPDPARLAQLTAVLPSMAPPFHNRSGSERDIRPPPSDRFSRVLLPRMNSVVSTRPYHRSYGRPLEGATPRPHSVLAPIC
jgi:hypothetical protein